MNLSTNVAPQRRPRRVALTVVTALLLLLCGTLLVTEIRDLREAARGALCQDRLKQLGLAFQNYHHAYGTYPPACVFDPEGRPMHSWRALLLPMLDGSRLDYDLKKPWNSPKNVRFADANPELAALFRCPSDDEKHPEWTSYVAVTGPRTLWPVDQAVRLDNLADERGTLLLVELHESGIGWLEPRDVSAEEIGKWEAREKANHPDGFHFVTSGGDVGTLGGYSSLRILAEMATRHRANAAVPSADQSH